MLVEIGMDTKANHICADHRMPGGASLHDYALFACRHLACEAVVIRLVHPSGRPVDQVIAHRPEPARLPLASCLDPERAPKQDKTSAVTDADVCSLADPVSAGKLGFAFYAGIPLRTRTGTDIGVLAALDVEQRPLSSDQYAMLKLLACVIVQTVEARLAA